MKCLSAWLEMSEKEIKDGLKGLMAFIASVVMWVVVYIILGG